MQQFLMDYGLWLLAAVLIVIAVVFLLTRGGGSQTLPAEMPLEAASAEAVPMEPIAAVIAPQEPMAAPAPANIMLDEATSPASAALPSTSADDSPDDLLRMKGIGPKLNSRLIELGITRFAQIAAWKAADIEAIDAQLGSFKGRPTRDQWVDQASYLAAGDIAGFEAKYGKL